MKKELGTYFFLANKLLGSNTLIYPETTWEHGEKNILEIDFKNKGTDVPSLFSTTGVVQTQH